MPSIVEINGRSLNASYTFAGYISNITVSGGSYTVPSDRDLEVLNARAVVTTTATAGNRTYALRVTAPGGGVAYLSTATANLAASQSNAVREVTPGSTPYWAGGGSTISMVDTAGIDTANDTVNVTLTVRVRPLPR